MATKSSTVLARIEPDIKEQAESIMTQLGVPASIVINMLYKQIILTKSIPFALSVPNELITRDEMNSSAFDDMMNRGLNDAKANRSRPAAEVFSELRNNVR